MPLPPHPTPGLVVHFDYLWANERRRGEEAGFKKRPCVIVVAVRDTHGQIEVVVAPITHREPSPERGIEMPRKVKSQLGLDNLRSWVIVDDLNTFIWPGVDLHPVPNSPPGTHDYGYVPPFLLEKVKAGIQAANSMGKATRRAS